MNTSSLIKSLLLFAVFFIYSNSYAQVPPKKEQNGGVQNVKTKVVTVTTVEGFLNSIASNTTIKLKGHSFFISDLASANKVGKYYSFVEVYDGYELLISDVKNLKIVGTGNTPVRMYARPDYGNVISFNNCENVTIENVDAGHGASKGSCVGGVFKIENSKDFYIKNTIMYGSGIEGITTNNVSNLVCVNSFIRSCTYSIMTLNGSNDISFENCVFEDNGVYDLVNIQSCSRVNFKNCSFEKNRTENSNYSDYSLFKVNQSNAITLQHCFIEANATDYLCNDSKILQFQKVEVNHNEFTKGKYKD
ncbi:right-handed parallel beta-helix repeat-containing protein [Bernardetia sp.]|uniref:right-handed parallel beta-helix repeat-containing protein n=1 Tax=Bernardetia sp. TaxID=1937974 RepID=UPI0025C4EF5A|nr:right-handed parallel beta-helix repeat-containing protein [Bernardetia sp.]